MQAAVLSGGGAWGAYEVGVLKALYAGKSPGSAAPFAPRVFTGTSVGAFNAAALVMHSDDEPGEAIAALEDLWLHRIAEQHPGGGNGVLRLKADPFRLADPLRAVAHPLDFFVGLLSDSATFADYGLHRGEAFLRSSEGPAGRTMQWIDLAGVISVEPLRRTIAEEIAIDRIRTATVELRIVATDWQHGAARVFTQTGITGEAILASAAIPGVFPAVAFDGATYVDGGVTMNTPLKPAIDAGADVLHVISLDPSLQRLPLSELDSTVAALSRTLVIAVATAIKEDMASARWINRGLAALARARSGAELTNDEVRDFVRVADKLEAQARAQTGLRPIEIHHYRPQQALGGPLEILNFSRSAIQSLIATGFADAQTHDCGTAGCVLPAEGTVAQMVSRA